MAIQLRPYQQRSIDQLKTWLRTYEGNPCVVLPTGAGKSIICACLCLEAIQSPTTGRVLVLTHVKELIQQNFDAMLRVWPGGDVGIYSAGIGIKDLSHRITFGGIQSLYKLSKEIGRVGLIIIDEAHLINHNASGMYRRLIDELKAHNPELRVIGLTATPFRLGHGLITDKPAIFSEPLVQPISIEELQDEGYLAPLTSKATGVKLETKGVEITAGDFNHKQLEEAVDVPGKTLAVVKEVLRRAGARKSWLFFCTGVHHAESVCDMLQKAGLSAACVTGKTPREERRQILQDFKDGKIKAVTNANVLTTGFDNPNIDLIVLMRPTMSAGLYVQMVGRGLRVAPDKENCLVLDFAGNVMRHGPIHNVQPPRKGKKREGDGIAPLKVCPQCMEYIPLNAKTCPVCGYQYPVKPPEERKDFILSTADINGKEGTDMKVSDWLWRVCQSRAGNLMVQVRYYPQNVLQHEPVSEYLVIGAPNDWARAQALGRLLSLSKQSMGQDFVPDLSTNKALEDLCYTLNISGKKPTAVRILRDGKYYKIKNVFWQ